MVNKSSLLEWVLRNGRLFYKIDELTKKVNEHNNLIKRTYDLEARADLADAELHRVNHRLENLEEEKK